MLIAVNLNFTNDIHVKVSTINGDLPDIEDNFSPALDVNDDLKTMVNED